MTLKICVLGATGFIGSSIIRALNDQSIEWIGISRHSHNHPKIIPVSLENNEQLISIINEYPIVINAIGSYKPKDFETTDKIILNSFWENLIKLSKILSASKIQKFLHISSGGTVYGDFIEKPFTEADALMPISWYGRTKVIEELIFEKLALKNDFEYICARITNPFNKPVNNNHGFVDVLINAIKEKKSFSTYKNNHYSRDFIHSNDMARILIKLIQHEHNNHINIYNVGSGKETYLLELVNKVKNFFPQLEVRNKYTPTNFDVNRNAVNISKLVNIIGPFEFEEVFDFILKECQIN